MSPKMMIMMMMMIIIIITITIIISLTECNSGTIKKLPHFAFIVRISSNIKQLHVTITEPSWVCFD